MAKKAPVAPAAKRIWRMTPAAPMGEYVSSAQRESIERLAEPEVSHGGWIESSFDLLRGVDVTEHDATMPEDGGWADTQAPD
jgi:hypothetical protein